VILDLHIHSRRSIDAWTSPAQIIQAAKLAGLNGVAVTDHETLRGGLETMELNDDPSFLVIPGAEYHTDSGDVIGLFLHREITDRRPEEVVAQIHEQGGIAMLPHPWKGHRDTERLATLCDLVEGWNARTDPESNVRATSLATQVGRPVVAGSDAHFAFEIGTCRIHVTGEDVRQSLIGGQFTIETGHTRSWVPMLSQTVKSIRQHRLMHSAWYAASTGKKFLFSHT
jgi:predicted metal-dependent phosphoesterase TrpH